MKIIPINNIKPHLKKSIILPLMAGGVLSAVALPVSTQARNLKSNENKEYVLKAEELQQIHSSQLIQQKNTPKISDKVLISNTRLPERMLQIGYSQEVVDKIKSDYGRFASAIKMQAEIENFYTSESLKQFQTVLPMKSFVDKYENYYLKEVQQILEIIKNTDIKPNFSSAEYILDNLLKTVLKKENLVDSEDVLNYENLTKDFLNKLNAQTTMSKENMTKQDYLAFKMHTINNLVVNRIFKMNYGYNFEENRVFSRIWNDVYKNNTNPTTLYGPKDVDEAFIRKYAEFAQNNGKYDEFNELVNSNEYKSAGGMLKALYLQDFRFKHSIEKMMNSLAKSEPRIASRAKFLAKNLSEDSHKFVTSLAFELQNYLFKYSNPTKEDCLRSIKEWFKTSLFILDDEEAINGIEDFYSKTLEQYSSNDYNFIQAYDSIYSGIMPKSSFETVAYAHFLATDIWINLWVEEWSLDNNMSYFDLYNEFKESVID